MHLGELRAHRIEDRILGTQIMRRNDNAGILLEQRDRIET
jgi:hypothetical protein